MGLKCSVTSAKGGRKRMWCKTNQVHQTAVIATGVFSYIDNREAAEVVSDIYYSELGRDMHWED